SMTIQSENSLREPPASLQEAHLQPLVLLADDDPVFVHLLEILLSSTGCRSVQGKDGWEALELFLRHQPDLVVLDISMPGIDGVAVCQEIKRDPSFWLTPVILISSSAGVDDHLR